MECVFLCVFMLCCVLCVIFFIRFFISYVILPFYLPFFLFRFLFPSPLSRLPELGEWADGCGRSLAAVVEPLIVFGTWPLVSTHICVFVSFLCFTVRFPGASVLSVYSVLHVMKNTESMELYMSIKKGVNLRFIGRRLEPSENFAAPGLA